MTPRLARAIVASLSLYCLTPSLVAYDWPKWRGPMSNGAADVDRAPERWSSEKRVAWRAPIEGYGISSPVAVGDRVYLTTAIAGQQRPTLRRASDYLIGLLSVLGLPAILIPRCRAFIGAKRGPSRWRVGDVLDVTLFACVSLALVAFGIVTVEGPGAIDAGLNQARDGLVVVARFLGRHETNLSFLDWDEGNRHNTWIISSSVALLSLGLTPFLNPGNAPIRIASAVVLLVGVGVATSHVPWAPAYGSRVPTGALIALYSPVVALAVWHLLKALRGVRAVPVGGLPKAPSGSGRVLAGVPAMLSVALFASPNLLYQRDVITRRVVCLDARTGAELWHTDVFSTPPATKSALNSDATPTPIVVNDTLVVAFGPGMAALDLRGQVLWLKMFPGWIENSIYGAGSSPATDGLAVFMAADREYESAEESRVLAYSIRTGEEIWSDTPESAHDGYTTPVVYDDGYRKLLLTLTSGGIVAYNAASGRAAWRLQAPIHQPIPTLIVEEARMFVTGGIGGHGYTAAYDLGARGAPQELWSNRNKADVASPVLYRGRLFTISSTGTMLGYDAASGRILWSRRIGSGPGAFYASLVAAAGKVYAVRSNGTTYVVAAADQFRMISESALPEEVFATPAVTDRCLLMRTVAAVYCIEP
jgi:outer membrane protein assembly factor BamB